MSIKAQIISVLSSIPCSSISFMLENIQINGPDYKKIANMIGQGQIQIVQTRNKQAGDAEYRCDRATILVGMTSYDDLIVHECTHAIQDVRGKPTNRLASEVVAYVAQVMYKAYKNGIDPKQPLPANPVKQSFSDCAGPGKVNCPDAIGNAAGQIVLNIMNKKKVPQKDIDTLYKMVRSYSKYSWIPVQAQAPFDGLGTDRFFTPQELQQMPGQLVI